MIDQHDSLVARAASFAARAHGGQMRKASARDGAPLPYIVHPIGVGMILRDRYPESPELEAAGYLHDVLEDTPYDRKDVELRFGRDVAFLVDSVTRRVGHDVHRAMRDSIFVTRLKAADVLDNARDTVRGLDKGYAVWERFADGPGNLFYWDRILEVAGERIRNETLYEDLVIALNMAAMRGGRR